MKKSYNLSQVIKIKIGPDQQGKTCLDGRHQEVVANVIGYKNKNEMMRGECYPNARLISCSPKLLEVLEESLEIIQTNYDVITYEVDNKIQGTLYNDDDVLDARELLEKIQRIIVKTTGE